MRPTHPLGNKVDAYRGGVSLVFYNFTIQPLDWDLHVLFFIIFCALFVATIVAAAVAVAAASASWALPRLFTHYYDY